MRLKNLHKDNFELSSTEATTRGVCPQRFLSIHKKTPLVAASASIRVNGNGYDINPLSANPIKWSNACCC